MAQDRRINASELDFATLKANLISYMEEQPGAFQDYNFDGAALNTVIDVLSYITHINSVNANFALNETFLDTAQLRESVVSHAKLLGYTPRSTSPAVATVDVEVIDPTDVLFGSTYITLIMSRGTPFSTTIGNLTTSLFVEDSVTANIDVNGQWIFKDVKLTQGLLINRSYSYDESGFDRYILANDFVDTSSLKVEVFESGTTSKSQVYTKSTNITNINSSSKVYFIEEAREGFYEVKFGDGIIGNKLEAGNIIKLNYAVVGDADIVNSTVFTLTGTIAGNTNVLVTTTTPATGGAPAESIDSIRFSAPLAFVAQNRAVTPDDYVGIIKNSPDGGQIETLTVWGGEDNIPPDYGKVYISIKPLGAEVLTDIEKQTIIGNVLKPKNVVSITPILVDPDYTYIDIEVYYKYNPNVANVTPENLGEGIRTVIQNYNDQELKVFGGIFRYSNLLQDIDNSNVAVISNITRISMVKKFTPELGVDKLYQFYFNQAIQYLAGKTQYITSTEFTYRDETCRLKDYYNEEEAKQVIQIVSGSGNVLNPYIGYLDYGTGYITLEGFAPDAIVGPYTTLSIETKPASNDISPTRNELLVINYASAIIQGEIDTMVTGGTTAGIDYTTVSS
jgi:hypothetical protein